ncbi:MAG: hypothetical protein EB059_07510 [Alphaproteobacteria bacterium]|nr:hypothetical protein [Alphaproteobacteria bacterium]
MNSDYVLKGALKSGGQIALHRPDWAGFTAAREAAQNNDPAVTDDGAAVAAKPTYNAFNHSGANKKTVGPDVDNVDFTFEDFIDTINPLQQIPVVNMIYRELTGDKIGGVAQVAGSTLYWGPLGIVTGVIDAIFQQERGGDVGETIMASIFGSDEKAPDKAPDTMLADATPVDNMPVDNAVASAALATPSLPKVAAKQPFGGVMGNETPKAAENILDESAKPASAPATVTTAHTPVEVDGRKMYSLAGILRHPGSPAVMPQRDVPDVRLKSYAQKGQAKNDAAKNDNVNMLLGLQNPTASVAEKTEAGDLPNMKLSPPGLDLQTPAGNALPAQLIQDMMMINMQKYQDGLKNGALRGHSVDVQG